MASINTTDNTQVNINIGGYPTYFSSQNWQSINNTYANYVNAWLCQEAVNFFYYDKVLDNYTIRAVQINMDDNASTPLSYRVRINRIRGGVGGSVTSSTTDITCPSRGEGYIGYLATPLSIQTDDLISIETIKLEDVGSGEELAIFYYYTYDTPTVINKTNNIIPTLTLNNKQLLFSGPQFGYTNLPYTPYYHMALFTDSFTSNPMYSYRVPRDATIKYLLFAEDINNSYPMTYTIDIVRNVASASPEHNYYNVTISSNAQLGTLVPIVTDIDIKAGDLIDTYILKSKTGVPNEDVILTWLETYNAPNRMISAAYDSNTNVNVSTLNGTTFHMKSPVNWYSNPVTTSVSGSIISTEIMSSIYYETAVVAFTITHIYIAQYGETSLPRTYTINLIVNNVSVDTETVVLRDQGVPNHVALSTPYNVSAGQTVRFSVKVDSNGADAEKVLIWYYYTL